MCATGRRGSSERTPLGHAFDQPDRRATMSWITAEQPGSSDVGPDGRVRDDLVTAYRDDGFVRVRGVLDPDQVERFRTSAEAFLTAHRTESLEKQGAFSQLVNVWQRDETLRALTLDPRLGPDRRAPRRLPATALARSDPGEGAAQQRRHRVPPGPPVLAARRGSAPVVGLDSARRRTARARLYDLSAGHPGPDRPAPPGPPSRGRPLRGGRVAALGSSHHRAAAGRRLHLPQRLHRAHGPAEPHRRRQAGARRHLHGRGHDVQRRRRTS